MNSWEMCESCVTGRATHHLCGDCLDQLIDDLDEQQEALLRAGDAGDLERLAVGDRA